MRTNYQKKHRPLLLITCYTDNLIETRRISNGKVLAAKPLYDDTINEIFGHLQGSSRLLQWSGRIPHNVLYCNNFEKVIVWCEKASVKKQLHINKKYNTKFANPKLVFKLNKGALSVWAVKTFSNKAKLYKAPFVNVNESVCLGSASIKINRLKYWEDVLQKANDAFWLSKFSHDHTDYTLLGRNKDKFPTSKLEETGSYSKNYKIEDLWTQ